MSVFRPYQSVAGKEIIRNVQHNGVLHHPLGGAAYYFKKNLVNWLADQIPQSNVQVHVGAQLNSSPHMGNTVVFACAFALAAELRKVGKNISLMFGPIDTAPSTGAGGQLNIDGVRYQRSLRFNGESQGNNTVFQRMLDAMSKASGMEYTERPLRDALVTPATPRVLRHILANRTSIGRIISPDTGRLSVRSPCPQDQCGLSDKHGKHTRFTEDHIVFHCPHHGEYTVALDDMAQLARLEFNTPLRNLLRFSLDAESPDFCLRVTGGDYAGFYQEQMMWRPLVQSPSFDPRSPPIIAYSPPILDWSGAKLSKSLYVKEDAYKYLEGTGLEYMLCYEKLEAHPVIGPEDVYAMCREWIATPYKYFRSYSIYAVHELLMNGREGGEVGK